MRVAIIGLGVIGNLHTEVLLEQGVDIVAICDIDNDRLVSLSDKYNLKAIFYNDYRKMIDENVIDVVHVCTPHYLHAEMVIYALLL